MTTYFKFDNDAVDHPKVAGLSDRAFRWWVKGLSYASRLLTDGVVPPNFWKQIPKAVLAELTSCGLWEQADPNFLIHDYLDYQSSKEQVAEKRAAAAGRQTRYRTRERNAVTGNDSSADRNALVTRPDTDNRDQIQRSDTREQRQQKNALPPLIKSPAYIEERKKHCAFVGGRLEVPHGLHAELRKLLGGGDADDRLMAWYEAVDAEIEASGEAIAPDVFKWLKARYATKFGAMTAKSKLKPVAMTRFASLGVRK